MLSLPTPPIWPLRFIPDVVHTVVLAGVFSHLLRGQPLAARLRELDGKTVCIHVNDVPCRLQFLILDGRLYPAPANEADVHIDGSLHAFWLLATRQEDPDTLFFSRRLSIEGETETGLHIKNLLDSLEYDWGAHFTAVLGQPLAAALSRVYHQAFLR